MTFRSSAAMPRRGKSCPPPAAITPQQERIKAAFAIFLDALEAARPILACRRIVAE